MGIGRIIGTKSGLGMDGSVKVSCSPPNNPLEVYLAKDHMSKPNAAVKGKEKTAQRAFQISSPSSVRGCTEASNIDPLVLVWLQGPKGRVSRANEVLLAEAAWFKGTDLSFASLSGGQAFFLSLSSSL